MSGLDIAAPGGRFFSAREFILAAPTMVQVRLTRCESMQFHWNFNYLQGDDETSPHPSRKKGILYHIPAWNTSQAENDADKILDNGNEINLLEPWFQGKVV
jgi:hypothetical protein